MARRDEIGAAVAVAGFMAIGAWFLSGSGSAKVSAQLKAAAQAGSNAPVTVGNPVNHGVVPEKWVPHVPANAHMGPHKMYRHPKRCSPVLTAPVQRDYDWLYSPPGEGDL